LDLFGSGRRGPCTWNEPTPAVVNSSSRNTGPHSFTGARCRMHGLVGIQLQQQPDLLRGRLHVLPEDAKLGCVLEDVHSGCGPAGRCREADPLDLFGSGWRPCPWTGPCTWNEPTPAVVNSLARNTGPNAIAGAGLHRCASAVRGLGCGRRVQRQPRLHAPILQALLRLLPSMRRPGGQVHRVGCSQPVCRESRVHGRQVQTVLRPVQLSPSHRLGGKS